VMRWMSERPGIPRDEFIDDIPFPETQAYVKKILGTAEDYRRLYGPEGARGSEDGDDDALPAVAHQAKPPVAKKAAAGKAPVKPAANKKAPKKPAHRKKSASRKKKSA